jgi:hypothetical protein
VSVLCYYVTPVPTKRSWRQYYINCEYISGLNGGNNQLHSQNLHRDPTSTENRNPHLLNLLKVNANFALEQVMKTQRGEYNDSSTLSSTSVLDKGKCLTPRLGRFTPGKETRYWKLGGRQRRCGRVRKISPPQEFDLRTVQPLASRYTCYAISALFHSVASSLFSEL